MAENDLPFGAEPVEKKQEKGTRQEFTERLSGEEKEEEPPDLSFGAEPVATPEAQAGRGPMGLPLGTEEEPQEAEGNEFIKGVKRGGIETGGLAMAGKGMFADMAGDIAGWAGFESGEDWLDSVAEDDLQQAQELMNDAEQYSADVGKVENIDSPGEAVSYVAGVLGEQTPIIAGALISGGVGAAAGKFATKVAVKKGLKKTAKEGLETQLKSAAKKGATAGVAGYSTGIEGGGIYQETAEATEEGETYPWMSGGGGAIAGALETLPFITVARRLGVGKKATTQLLKNIDELPRAKRALATGALISGQEAGTEALQEATAMTARDIVDEDYEMLGDEGMSRLFNAAVAGGVVGGTVGTVSGAVGKGEPAQGEGLPPTEAPETGVQGPQEGGAAPQQLPRPPIYAEPPEGLSEPQAGQRDLFKDPIQPGKIKESAPPKAGMPDETTKVYSDYQLEFGEFLAPHREGGKQRIISIGKDGKARETDVESLQRSIISDVRGKEPGVGGSELQEIITGEPQAQFEPSGPIEIPEARESPNRIYQNTRVVGQARKHGRNVQDLMGRREEIIQSNENYTQKGSLRTAAKKKLNTIEGGIRKSTERAGLGNPLEGAQEESTAPAIEEKGQRGIEEEYVDLTEEGGAPKEQVEPSEGLEEGAPEGQRISEEQRQQTREQAQEARRRVEGRKQVNQQEAQRKSDEQVEEELRNLGIDPDEIDGFLESRKTPQDTQRAQTDQKKRQSDAHQENVESFVRKLEEQFPGLRNVDVVVKRKLDYIADYGAEDPRTAMALQGNANGFYIPMDSVSAEQGNPEAHIIADAIPTGQKAMEKEATRIFVHEAIVHGGLDNVLTKSEKAEFREMVAKKAKDDPVWEQIKEAYGDRSEYVQAEEYVARVAQTNAEPGFLQRIAAKVRRILRKFIPDLQITQGEIKVMLSDLGAGLSRGRISQSRAALSPYVSSSGRTYDHRAAANIDSILHDLEAGDSPAEREGWSASINHQAKIWKADLANMFLTPIQLAKEYGIRPMVDYYTNVVPHWWNIKNEIISKIDDQLPEISRMGQDKVDTLGRMWFRATLESDRQERRMPISFNEETGHYELSPELYDLWRNPDGTIQKKAIEPDQELIDHFGRMDNAIRETSDRMERGLKYNAIRESISSAAENPRDLAQQILDTWDNARGDQKMDAIAEQVPNIYGQELIPARRLQEIENQFNTFRNRNYFPLMRFGRYTASVVATKDGVVYDGETFNKGQPIIFETFEGAGPQQSRKKELIEEIGETEGMKVHSGKLTDEEFSFLGLPPALQENMQEHLSLTEDQKARLQEIFIKMSPGRSFLKHLLKRKGTKGFSTDVLRTYASYMSNAAGHLARIETHLDMQDSIQAMDQVARDMQASGDNTDATVVNKLHEGMRDHYDWIMNPKGELAGLRALGFQWYLGFNPRSALVNLTQVPLATYPYLAERYGDKAVVRELTKAMKAGARSPRGEKVNVDNETWEMMNRGVQEGWMDEGLATETAGYAEAGAVQRFLPSDSATRLINNASYYGSWMFTTAEQYNRRVTAVATYRLARKNGESHENGIKAAREAVQDTQFEYAKWNRPKFMQGKKSIFFLFWQYMQHATYLAAGRHGKGTAARFWLMLGLAGGLQGLPYAEVFMTLLNQMGSEWKEWLGMDDPKRTLQGDLRELANELGANPEIMMHGLSRYYGLGPLHVLSAAGAPVPNVDISGSISMGDFPPGITQLMKGEGARATAEGSGAVFNVPIAVWKSLTSDNPDKWKEWERAMPTVVRNASRSVRYAQRGKEETSAGAELVEFDPMDKQHHAEIVAQALGFPSTRKNVAWEELMAKREAKRYFLTRRTMLMQDFAYMKRRESREGLADIRKEIRRFNDSVPSPKLRITSDQLQQSMERRQARQAKTEKGIPSENMAVEIYQDMEDLYPDFD